MQTSPLMIVEVLQRVLHRKQTYQWLYEMFTLYYDGMS
jgi:hypothetical protein